MANVFDLIGRIFISALFLISAFNKIFDLDGSMGWMEGFGVPGFLIFPAIAIEIILPVLVIVGYQARIAAGILAIFGLATAFIFHFDFSDQAQFISFLKNISYSFPSLKIFKDNFSDKAFTTETPTPCKPPETLYES